MKKVGKWFWTFFYKIFSVFQYSENARYNSFLFLGILLIYYDKKIEKKEILAFLFSIVSIRKALVECRELNDLF